jgi:hypothetical protein
MSYRLTESQHHRSIVATEFEKAKTAGLQAGLGLRELELKPSHDWDNQTHPVKVGDVCEMRELSRATRRIKAALAIALDRIRTDLSQPMSTLLDCQMRQATATLSAAANAIRELTPKSAQTGTGEILAEDLPALGRAFNALHKDPATRAAANQLVGKLKAAEHCFAAIAAKLEVRGLSTRTWNDLQTLESSQAARAAHGELLAALEDFRASHEPPPDPTAPYTAPAKPWIRLALPGLGNEFLRLVRKLIDTHVPDGDVTVYQG